MHQVCTIDHYILMTITSDDRHHGAKHIFVKQVFRDMSDVGDHKKRAKYRLILFHIGCGFGSNWGFFSGFRQRPWWVFCRRNTWFRSRRWSTTARSSWTSTTSWAKWRSFRREPFLHLSIRPHFIQSSIWFRPTRISSEADLNRHIPFGIAKPIYCKMFSKFHVLYIHMISKDQ